MGPFEKLWLDLEDRSQHLPRGRKHVQRLRSGMLESAAFGEEIAPVEDALYPEALEMFAASVELMASRERLALLEERLKLRKRQFWLSVREASGVELDEAAAFDPFTGSIRKQRAVPKAEAPRSYEVTLHKMREMVRHALWNPLDAGRMALDASLPAWLQQLAGVVGSGDLKPSLRGVLESCLEQPEAARTWHGLAVSERLPAWFAETMRVLGALGSPAPGEQQHLQA